MVSLATACLLCWADGVRDIMTIGLLYNAPSCRSLHNGLAVQCTGLCYHNLVPDWNFSYYWVTSCMLATRCALFKLCRLNAEQDTRCCWYEETLVLEWIIPITLTLRLLKSDSICESCAQMKRVQFFWLTVQNSMMIGTVDLEGCAVKFVTRKRGVGGWALCLLIVRNVKPIHEEPVYQLHIIHYMAQLCDAVKWRICLWTKYFHNS